MTVWWGVSYRRVTEAHFCKKKYYNIGPVYIDTIHEKVVKPLNENHVPSLRMVFSDQIRPESVM